MGTAVGGEFPQRRDQVGTDENAVLSDQGALNLLNQRAWDLASWADFELSNPADTPESSASRRNSGRGGRAGAQRRHAP